MKILCVIPARLGSSRFPNKPLKLINNIPMIGYVYKKVIKNKFLTKTYVATCDKKINNYMNSINGNCIMTSKSHERASDRCAEAVKKIEKKENIIFDIIVMVQGDEPLINAKMIDQAIKPMLKSKKIEVVNLLGKIKSLKEFNDRNCIKVVCDKNNYALYFSREPIPTMIRSKKILKGKQICVIPFRKKFLFKYAKMRPTPLEIIESIDMLRILENGGKVYMARTNYNVQSVDTPADLKKVINIINKKKKKK